MPPACARTRFHAARASCASSRTTAGGTRCRKGSATTAAVGSTSCPGDTTSTALRSGTASSRSFARVLSWSLACRTVFWDTGGVSDLLGLGLDGDPPGRPDPRAAGSSLALRLVRVCAEQGAKPLQSLLVGSGVRWDSAVAGARDPCVPTGQRRAARGAAPAGEPLRVGWVCGYLDFQDRRPGRRGRLEPRRARQAESPRPPPTRRRPTARLTTTPVADVASRRHRTAPRRA